MSDLTPAASQSPTAADYEAALVDAHALLVGQSRSLSEQRAVVANLRKTNDEQLQQLKAQADQLAALSGENAQLKQAAVDREQAHAQRIQEMSVALPTETTKAALDKLRALMASAKRPASPVVPAPAPVPAAAPVAPQAAA